MSDYLTTKLAEALRQIIYQAERGTLARCEQIARDALASIYEAKAQPVQDLPPLPESVRAIPERSISVKDLCTADQMHAYARAGYIAGLEAAASAIEPKCDPEDWTEYAGDCASLARVIRNLKGKA